MLRAESTLICSLALLAPQFLLHVPLQAFFQHGLWIVVVQLAGILLLAQPLIFCELALGQRSRYGPVKCWCFGPAWKGIGLLMLVTSALDLMSLNVDLLEYLKAQKQQQHQTVLAQVPLIYMQAGLWLALLPLLILWPKFTSKLWVLGNLVCLGGIIALAARSLSLSHTEASLQRLLSLSAQLPSNPLDLLRTSLLPFLSTAGTGIMISLGSYRSPGAKAITDSIVVVTLVFLIGAVLILSTSGLAANYCLVNSMPGINRTVACNLEDPACPMIALEGARNSSCDFLAYHGADSAENFIKGANMYAKLLESLPRNQVSPVAWLWCLRCVLAWLCLTYVLVRADTWVRAIADKFQGAKRMRDCRWTARFLGALITCPAMGSLAFLMHHYRHVVSVRDVYQMSTVRWLPLLLGALACLAITHGYGGVRFVKEIGGGGAMRPWFYALVGFVTPALTIAVAGLRMHVSIAALLWPDGGQAYFINNAISQKFRIPNYVNLVLAVSAFLFLLAGLFTPLIWHGICRRQRCIDLVQPTKSWHRNQESSSGEQRQQQQPNQRNQSPRQRNRSRNSSDDSSANGGDVVRDLGATTIEESPMLHTMRQQQQQQPINSNKSAANSSEYTVHQHHLQQSEAATMSWPQRPLLSTAASSSAQAALPPPPPPPPPLPHLLNERSAPIPDGSGYGTVRFHASGGKPEPQQRSTMSPYSTATLPGNSGPGGSSGGVIRFNLSEDNPTVTKTLNRGILKNKHESFRQHSQQQQENLPLATNHGAGDRQHRGSTDIL